MDLYFNLFKIKYSILDELLINEDFVKGEEIFIYINIEPILKKLTSTITDRENVMFESKRNMILSSCIFNLIAHYRYYFHKKSVSSLSLQRYPHMFSSRNFIIYHLNMSLIYS